MTQSFGPFTFDPDRRSLTRGGQSTELGQRASALLAALLAAGGHPVSKATLMDAVWPDTTVEEGNLTVQISGLRKALGPGPGGAEYIVTVPRIGYRLVQEAVLADAELPLRPALAVMPFANLSGDVGQDYFADGVVEDIIIALSKFRSFAVIARNSTFAYRGRSPGVPQVATELGVLYVLEGSVRRMGDHIRITAQLVDGKNGSNLWAQNFDGATADIFDVQDQITASVAAVVGTKIELAEIDRSHRKRPGNLDAYDYYLRALQKLYTYLDADNLAAITLLHQAIALEPDFALALAWAAYGYEHRVTMGWDAASPDDGAKALELARAAIAVARDDPIVLARCGFVLQAIGREYDQGLQTILRAVNSNPNNVTVLFIAGVGHVWGGDLVAAMAMFQRVIQLSPGDTAGAMTGVAHGLICLGRHEEALDWASRSLAEQPNFDVTHWLVIAALAHLGRISEAEKALAVLLRLAPASTITRLSQSTRGKYPERWSVILDGLRLAGMAEQ